MKETVHNLTCEQKLPATAQNLIIPTPRTSVIYLKPQIHKPNNSGRPVVSTYSCPTELISQYFDQIMSPFVKSLPSYIKDTNNALKTFRDFNCPGENKLIFTNDITYLYIFYTQLFLTIKDSWRSNPFLTNASTNNLTPKRLLASLNSFLLSTAVPIIIVIVKGFLL